MRVTTKSFVWLAALALMPIASACDEARLHSWVRHFDLFFPSSAFRSDTFTQEAAAMIDILWVVDNSESMQEEQNNLAHNFQNFIQFIEDSAVDYQIGVISTDMDRPDHQGKLLGSPTIIVSGPNAVTQFQQNVRVGTTGAGNEKGLYAAYTALSEPLISGHNAGFLREDSSLAVIFVSDEDDHSTGMVSFYQRMISQLKGVGNDRKVILGAIVGDPPGDQNPDGGCHNMSTGSAKYGERYLELVDLLSGTSGSICAQNFGETLSQLGLTAAGLSRKFTLSDNQPEDGTIQVFVDGIEVPESQEWGWVFENGSIFFGGYYVPESGALIEVNYLHPQREYILSQEPKYDETMPGQNIAVRVYPEGATECAERQDCTEPEDCGLAGICGGELIPYDYMDGWILKTKLYNEEKLYIVTFERNYYPPGGATVEVSYQCQGGCRVQ